MKSKRLWIWPGKLIVVTLVFFSWFSLLWNATAALADNTNKEHTILLSPTDATFDVEAGKSYTGSFGIYNTGQIDFDFTVYTEPFSLKDGCTQDFTTKSDQTRLADWIKFDQTEYSLKAGESVTVDYRIDVPEDIPAGGQYAVIFSETGTGQTGMIGGTKRLGYKVYVRTNGETILKGSVGETKISALKFDNKLSVSVPVKNDGNTDFVADGMMEVKNLFGQTVYVEKYPLRVLPGGSCAVKLTWSNAPIFGLFQTTVTTKALGETTTQGGWTLFVSPIIIGVIVLVILAMILRRHYGQTKRRY